MDAILQNLNGSNGIGKVISVRGSVVDISFEDHLPPVYTLLKAGDDAQIPIEILSQLDSHRVRGIALSPTQGAGKGNGCKKYGRASESSGWKRDHFTNVRCFWQYH